VVGASWKALDPAVVPLLNRIVRVPCCHQRELFLATQDGLAEVKLFLTEIEAELLEEADPDMQRAVDVFVHSSTKLRSGSVGIYTDCGVDLTPGVALDAVAAVVQCSLLGDLEFGCDPRTVHYDVAWDQRMIVDLRWTDTLRVCVIEAPQVLSSTMEARYQNIANGCAHRLMFARDNFISPAPPKNRMLRVLYLGERSLDFKDLRSESVEDKRSLFKLLAEKPDFTCSGADGESYVCTASFPCFIVVSLGGEFHNRLVERCRTMLRNSFDVVLQKRGSVCDMRGLVTSRFGQEGNFNHQLKTELLKVTSETAIITMANCGLEFFSEGPLLTTLCDKKKFPHLRYLDVSMNRFPHDEEYEGLSPLSALHWVDDLLEAHVDLQVHMYDCDFDKKDPEAVRRLGTKIDRIHVDKLLHINSLL
jgi:hypothetical protein